MTYSPAKAFAMSGLLLAASACGGTGASPEATAGQQQSVRAATAAASASCTPGTSLTGSFYFSYNNGQPFTVPQEHNATIAITTDFGPPAFFIESEIPVSPEVNPSGFVFSPVGGYSSQFAQTWAIGVQSYDEAGTTDGVFGPGKTSFSWVLNVPLTFDNFYGAFAGVVTHVTLTEPSTCEVDYDVEHVRDNFPFGQVPPTQADMVTDKYVFLRSAP